MPDAYQWVCLPLFDLYIMLMYNFIILAGLFSKFSLYLDWIFDLNNLCTFKRSAYHLPFNLNYYQSHLKNPPRYSQRSFQPPYPFKQPYPLTSSTHPSSIRQPFSSHDSSRIQNSLHNYGATLKKRRISSTTHPPASHISEALSSIKLARSRPHGWRSGYTPPSKSDLRRHFERFIAPFKLASKF